MGCKIILSRFKMIWGNTRYDDVCKLQISLIRNIGWKCTPLYLDYNGSIKYTPEENLGWLKIAFIAHSVTCFIKLASAMLYIYTKNDSMSNGKGAVIGRTVIYMYFAACGFVGTGHVLLKQRQLATFLNFLAVFDELDLGLGEFNSNVLMKMFALQAPSLTIGCSGIIGIQQFMQFEEPGSISYPITLLYKMSDTPGVKVVVKVFSVVVTVYEWWNLVWVLGLCAMPGFCGLFVGFGAVYTGAKTILLKSYRHGYSINESFRLYRRLQVLVSIVNECFQDDFALWIMTFLMTWAIITSGFLSDDNIRNGLDSQELYMCVILLCEIYCFSVVCYNLPGRANVISRRIRGRWTKHATTICGASAESAKSYNLRTLLCRTLDRRIVRSYQDVKLRFGSVNFYGRMTALVVTQFMAERSLKLMLLMKK